MPEPLTEAEELNRRAGIAETESRVARLNGEADALGTAQGAARYWKGRFEGEQRLTNQLCKEIAQFERTLKAAESLIAKLEARKT